MKILSVFFMFFLVITNIAFAQNVQGEFILSQPDKQFSEGDFLEATVRIWPIENVDLNQFKKLEKNVLFNSLYLAQITSLGVSQNNADVVELKALFIVKSANVTPVFNFKYNDLSVELNSGALALRGIKDQSKDFHVLSQSTNKSNAWVIGLVLLIVIFFAVFISRKKIQKFFIGYRQDSLKKSRKKYNEIFMRTSKRDDYEFIYKNREEWMSLLSIKAPAHFEFIKVINQHQFKKDWNSSDYDEVKSSFDIIRRSFEK